MKTLIIISIFVYCSQALELSDYKPIEEFYLQDPARYPAIASRYRNREFTTRIFGGQVATPGQFPFQAALFIAATNGDNYFCGGSLLPGGEYVLTAAHCADVAQSILVVLGAQSIRQAEASYVEVNVPKENIKVHEEFNSFFLRNDIAILKLPQAIASTDRIQPVKLPSLSDANSNFVGVVSTTSGWGRTKDTFLLNSPELRWVQTQIVPNSNCGIFYGSMVQSSNICASGRGGKSSCNGDSGGPLTVGEGSDKMQIGIVSFGSVVSCSIGFAHAYVRVTSYLDWIAANSNVGINRDTQ